MTTHCHQLDAERQADLRPGPKNYRTGKNLSDAALQREANSKIRIECEQSLADSRLEDSHLEREKASLSQQTDGVHDDPKQARSRSAEDAQSLDGLREQSAQLLTENYQLSALTIPATI